MALNVVKQCSDRIDVVGGHWSTWLKSADDLYMRFFDKLNGTSPLDCQKSGSLGFLASAAAMAGFLPMIECDAFGAKMNHWGGDRTRADFCIHADDHVYYFKFRRAGRPSGQAYLRRQMEHALDRLMLGRPHSNVRAAACVGLVTTSAQCIQNCEKFARSDFVDFAYRIGPSAQSAFLFFRLKE